MKRVLGNTQIENSHMVVVNSALILILVKIFDLFLYPSLGKSNPWIHSQFLNIQELVSLCFPVPSVIFCLCLESEGSIPSLELLDANKSETSFQSIHTIHDTCRTYDRTTLSTSLNEEKPWLGKHNIFF